MHRVVWLLLAITATGVADAATQPSPSKPVQVRSNVTEVPDWLPKVQALIDAGKADEARALIDAQLKAEKPGAPRGGLYFMRAFADAKLRDIEAFRADFAETIRLAPYPAPLLPSFVRLGAEVDPDTSLVAIEKLSVLSPEGVRNLDEGMIWYLKERFKQGNRTPEYQRLILSLADASFGKILEPDTIQLEAASILAGRGEIAKSLAHARQIRNRSSWISVLTDRTYASLWPELETAATDGLQGPARARLAIAQADFRKEPDSLDARLKLMRAYADLGMWADADALGREVGRTRAELMALTSTTANLVDEHANILLMSGRFDEADRRRAALIETWTDQRPWVINMAINRIGAFVDQGRYGPALDLLESQKARLEAQSSPYAKQLLRGIRVFALTGLGRKAEAEAMAPEIKAHADDAPQATLAALIRLGDAVSAEALALAWLKQPRFRSAIIEILRVDDTMKATDNPAENRMMRQFRARPAVKAAFDASARDLPERFRRTF